MPTHIFKNSSVNEWQQLSLKFYRAMTIHKIQGLTLANAWIHIGKNEKTPYVAISRVKTLSS